MDGGGRVVQQIKFGADDRPVRGRNVKNTKPKKARKKSAVTRKNRRSRSDFSPISGLYSFLSRFVKAIRSLTQSKPASRRRGAQRNWVRIAFMGLLFMAVAGPVGGLGYYMVQNSVIEKSSIWIANRTQDTVLIVGLTVQEISITGRERTSPKSLMKALSVARGDNILKFDPELARERIEKLGWVESASVMRRFPDEIYIRIDERRPFARWQKNNKTAVIDRKGEVVTYRPSPEFQYLPKVVGDGANEDAAELFDMLAKTPTLFTRLHNAVRIRDRRWNLEFDNGVSVMLPEEGAKEAWQKLYQMQKTKKVLNKGVVAIDLRSNNKIYVRLKPDDALVRRRGGNET